MNTEYFLRYRYVNDNPQGEYDIEETPYYTLEDAREDAIIYKENALNPIIIKIIKIEYKEEEIETV